METHESLDVLTQQAERIVQNHIGSAVSLRDPTVVAARERSLVVRCAATGWDGVESVVLKRNRGDDARGFTDWVSLEFLSTLPGVAGVAPRFYAGDIRQRLFVMEDLGGSHSLANLLDDSDVTAVVTALYTLANSMARLVAATRGREKIFQRMRAALPGAANLGRRREAARWLKARSRVARWADTLGLRMPHGFDTACAHIATVYAEPGAYLAFSHGDPAPTNNHIARGRVRLVDFEYAAYRHALYDMTAWEILCPLPREWVTVMDKGFRSVLATDAMGCALVDEGNYQEAWATLCAYRALAMITWFSPDLLTRDRAWVPEWTQRAALISTTLRLNQSSARVAAYEPLVELGASMAGELRERWPELGDGAPHWPVLGGAP